MIKRLILCFTLVGMFSCSEQAKDNEEPNEAETFLKFLDTIQEKKSASYLVEYRVKYMGQEDTLSIFGNVDLVKEKTDTLFGGAVWFLADNNQKKYYDLAHFYVFDEEEKLVHEHELHNQKVFKGSATSNLKDIFFLKSQFLKMELLDTLNTVHYGDTVIKGKPYHFAKVFKAVDPPFSDAINFYLIDAQEAKMTNIIQSISVKGAPQYKEWRINQLEYDTLSFESLAERFEDEKKNYTAQKHLRGKGKAEFPIADGQVVPDLRGTYYSDRSQFLLSKYDNQPKVLLFWKLDCEPCEESISHINDFYYKYEKTDLKIVGIYKTNNVKDMTLNLRAFLADKDMSYHAIMVDDKGYSDFKVHSYPTIYVVDRNNKVVYSQVGYAKSTLSSIEKAINQALK